MSLAFWLTALGSFFLWFALHPLTGLEPEQTATAMLIALAIVGTVDIWKRT